MEAGAVDLMSSLILLVLDFKCIIPIQGQWSSVALQYTSWPVLQQSGLWFISALLNLTGFQKP